MTRESLDAGAAVVAILRDVVLDRSIQHDIAVIEELQKEGEWEDRRDTARCCTHVQVIVRCATGGADK